MPYASMIALGTPEERARQAGQLADQGWKAIKLRLHQVNAGTTELGRRLLCCLEGAPPCAGF